MTDPAPPRLSSAYLEDLAHIALSARPDGSHFDAYPPLDDDVRWRLRSRLKQIARYDWPATLREDPALRRGYTLRQCCRLMVTLLLIDTHLPPSIAIALARNNELTILRSIAARLADPDRHEAGPGDLMCVVLPGEIRDALLSGDQDQDCRRQMFLIERGQTANLWADPWGAAGARLVIDVPMSAAAMWRWLAGRRLLDDTARLSLLADVERNAAEPGFSRKVELANRRI